MALRRDAYLPLLLLAALLAAAPLTLVRLGFSHCGGVTRARSLKAQFG